MFCPKCGKPVAEGALFCTNCGYKLPEMEASAEEAAKDRQEAGQEDTQGAAENPWQENEDGFQQEFQQAFDQAVQELREEEQEKEKASGEGSKPVREAYFSRALKVIIIILGALALLYGIIGRAVWGQNFGSVLLYAILPAATMIVTAILMNKVPPVFAAMPMGLELIISIVDAIRWGESADVVFCFIYAGLAALFVLLLVTRKPVFKVFSVILVCLISMHVICLWCVRFVNALSWYDLEELIEYLFEEDYLLGYLNCLQYVFYYNIAMVLLVLGVKKKAIAEKA